MTDSQDILVVDDNALDRELVRRLLPAGYSVAEAATGGEARACLASASPSLVILDNRLPDADGVDLLPLFAERHIPVVMLTEVEDPEVIVIAMQRGAEDYLVKGALTREGLSRVLANAVEKSAMRGKLHEQHLALEEQARVLQVRNGEIRSLATALTLAEQAERHRIAEFLHDDIQQLLVGAQLHLQVLRTADPKDHLELAGTAGEIVERAILSMRDLVAELTPPVLEDDLEVALRWLADHMSRLHRVSVSVDAGAPGHLPSRDVRVLVVQIVRELVFNAVKHAGVQAVQIRVDEEGPVVTVHVEDEGSGFDTAEVEQRPTRGFGLNSIRERLGLIGGGFEIASVMGRGTRATVTVTR